MRKPVTKREIEAFTKRLGRAAKEPTTVYLTGGACSVLRGWRTITNDIDMSMVPEVDSVYHAIPKIKEELHLNVEMAAPSQFIPELPRWQDRSVFISEEGQAKFYEYDFYSQALSKLVRGHDTDLKDVQHMVADGLVKPARLMELFECVQSNFIRFPSIDAAHLKNKMKKWAANQKLGSYETR